MITNGQANDAWIEAIPDNPYDLCPCGCGMKFRFVQKNLEELVRHEERFKLKWLENKHE